MSIECSECEQDARRGHADDCSIGLAYKKINEVKFPVIKYSEFNFRRHTRGADAARFDIADEDGETYWLWMSKVDIEDNIKLHPHCTEELQKGLNWY